MQYRFPSAMGEAQAAGAWVSPSYLEEVNEEVERFLSEAIPERAERVQKIREAIEAGAIEVILVAVEKCPSKDYILHHADGRIVRDISELA